MKRVQEKQYKPGEPVPQTGGYYLLNQQGEHEDSAFIHLKAGDQFPNISPLYSYDEQESWVQKEAFAYLSNISPDDFEETE